MQYITNEGDIMELVKKNCALVSNFVITCILCVFNTLTIVTIDSVLKNTFSRDTYYTDWKVLIIIFLCIILFSSVISLLFNLPQTERVNKTVQLILLCVNIVITIVCILFWVIVIYKINNHEYLLVIGEDLKTIDYTNYVVNKAYQDSFLVLVFASLSNLVAPICSLVLMKREQGTEVRDEEQEAEDDDTKFMRTEINKLKQQLELENMKKEYASLCKQLNKDTTVSNEETTKINKN